DYGEDDDTLFIKTILAEGPLVTKQLERPPDTTPMTDPPDDHLLGRFALCSASLRIIWEDFHEDFAKHAMEHISSKGGQQDRKERVPRIVKTLDKGCYGRSFERFVSRLKSVLFL